MAMHFNVALRVEPVSLAGTLTVIEPSPLPSAGTTVIQPSPSVYSISTFQSAFEVMLTISLPSVLANCKEVVETLISGFPPPFSSSSEQPTNDTAAAAKSVVINDLKNIFLTIIT